MGHGLDAACKQVLLNRDQTVGNEIIMNSFDNADM